MPGFRLVKPNAEPFFFFSKQTLPLVKNTSKYLNLSRLFDLKLQNASISVIFKILVHISFAYIVKTVI